MPNWTKYIERDSQGRASWFQWVDLNLANAWISEAARLTSASQEAAIEAMPYDQQLAAVRNAFAAVGNVYRSVSMPPQIDPMYRDAFKHWYGSTLQVDPSRTPGFDPSVGDIGPSYVGGGEITRRIKEIWMALGKAPIDDRNRLCHVFARLLLSNNAVPVEQCAVSVDSEGACNLNGLFTGRVDERDPRKHDVGAYNWHVMAWYDPPALWGAAEHVCRIEKCSPPLYWFFLFAREVAEALSSRGALNIVKQGRTLQILKNFHDAQVLFPGAANGVAELMEASALLPLDVENAVLHNPGIQQTAQIMGAIAAIAGVANPIAGAVLGAAAALYSTLPGAVGVELDEYGRGKPWFERTSIGTVGPTVPPETLRVPEPSGTHMLNIGALIPPLTPPASPHTMTLNLPVFMPPLAPPSSLHQESKPVPGAVKALAIGGAVWALAKLFSR